MICGAEGDRTPDPLTASQVLSRTELQPRVMEFIFISECLVKENRSCLGSWDKFCFGIFGEVFEEKLNKVKV
jgi:hypothetical protein